jgi:ribosomal protein L16/L10AE
MRNVAETIEAVLASFDHDNKRRLAELIADALELGDESNVIEEEAIERAESALNRSLSAEERYRVEILVRFFYSRPGGYNGGVKGNVSY